MLGEVAPVVDLEWLLAQRELALRAVVRPGAAGSSLSWAHAIELDDPTPWLSGGELVLTTGVRLARSAGGQRAYVERLADAGVAGIGFGVGVRHEEIPPAIVEACSVREMPLVEVPLPTPFIAITQTVASRLAHQQIDALNRAQAYQRRVTRSAVRGGLTGLVAVLGRELRCDAVVLDEYGVVMATSTRDDHLLDLVRAEWRSVGARSRPGTVGVPTEHGTLELQTLRGRSAVVGWLAVLREEAQSPTDRLLLNETAGLITMQLDWPAELVTAYHALGGAVLDLLLDPNLDATALAVQLRHFGFEPTDPVMLAVATAPRGHTRLLAILNEKLESTAHPHVVTRVEGGVAALLPARDAPMLVDVLVRAVRDARIGKVVFGVSAAMPQAETVTGLAPARQAAAAAGRARQGVGWFDDLTLSAVVTDEAIRSRVWTLAGPALEAVRRGATPREPDLLPSLEAFLQHNGSWEGAARALGIHRHTLRARIARVEALTGLDLDDAESRVLLLLAILSRPNATIRRDPGG